MAIRESSLDEQRPAADPAHPEGGVATTRPSAVRARRRGHGWSGRLEVLILVGPALLFFLGFVIYPVVMAAYYGFFSWQGFGPPTVFVGFRNYITILQDPTFHEALMHNAVIVVLSLVLQGPVAILVSLLLNRKSAASRSSAC